MQLAHRALGDEANPPIVILHGLLGSMRNWHAVARLLSDRLRIHLLDLRNHGRSPHAVGSSYDLQAGDVRRWMDDAGLAAAHVLGHSMGGKVAMRLACDEPALVERLTIVDIAPRGYSPISVELDAILALDVGGLQTRFEAMERLERAVPDDGMRQFLVSNLTAVADGGFRWRPNLPELVRTLPEIRGLPFGQSTRYDGPTQVIVGGHSSFVEPTDYAGIREHFPFCEIETIAASGHNPHVDAKEELVERILRFALPPSE